MADTEDTDETKIGDQYHPGMFVVGFWCYGFRVLRGVESLLMVLFRVVFVYSG